MITFEEIEIEGFGGFAKTFKFDLSQRGLNILNSRNGTRKTTIFSALCWVLYGKSLKPKSQIETWEDKRPRGWKGTMVTIRFSSDPGDKVTRIYRCLKYRSKIGGASGSSRLIIVHDGKELEFKDKYKAQDWIDKRLGMGFELFKNTVVFGQKMKRFIEEDGPTKKKIFEEIFDTAYLQQAKDIAAEKLEESRTSLRDRRIEWDNLGIKLQAARKILSTHKQVIRDFDKNKAKRLHQAENQLMACKDKITDITSKYKKAGGMATYLERLHKSIAEGKEITEKAKKLENDAFRLELTFQQNEAEYEGAKKTIKHLLSNLSQKHFTCSLCKQKLSPKHQQEHQKQVRADIAAEKLKRKKLKKVLDKDYKKLLAMRDEIPQLHYSAAMGELTEELDNLNNDRRKYYELVQDKQNILAEIKTIEAEKPSTKKLEKARKDIKILKKRREPISKIMDDLETLVENLEWVIKDPLSNSGIKAFIFAQMIKKVNAKLVNYDHIMNGLINFGIDLNTGNKDFYVTIKQGKHLRFYPDFSGGEQQLVNICIAFAMFDTIDENNPFNLLVLDEVFEGLDDENVDIVGDLVKAKSKGRCLFVITHKRSFIPNGSNLINI